MCHSDLGDGLRLNESCSKTRRGSLPICALEPTSRNADWSPHIDSRMWTAAERILRTGTRRTCSRSRLAFRLEVPQEGRWLCPPTF